MKTVLLHLLIGGIPFWLSPSGSEAADCDPGVEGQEVITVKCTSGPDGVECARTICGPGAAVITVNADASDESDGRSEKKAIRIKTGVKVDADAEEGGWLGVGIGEVPEALAVQLGAKGHGVIVQSVVDDSPADAAGFASHDIILSVGGEAVEGGLKRAVELIKAREPGDTVDVIVLRNGEEKTLTATLGSRADMKELTLEWMGENAPDAEIEDQIKTRGRFLFKGDDGQWVMKDLGDVDELLELPDNVRMFVPKSGSRSTQVFVEGGRKVLKTKVERDGSVIAIKRDGDGPIVVSRVDEDGEEAERSYGTVEELEKGDPEAFQLWEEAGDAVVVHLNVDGLGKKIEVLEDDLDDLDFDFDFDIDTDEWKEHATEWRSHIEEGLVEATEAYERAMEQLEKIREEWKSGAGLPALEKLDRMQSLFQGDDEHSGLPQGLRALRLGKPRHTFEVRIDGTIEVRIRKGDSELVQLFKDEDDLARRSPDLAEKYRELLSAAEE